MISTELTGNDKERQRKTGGLTPDDAGPTIAPVVFAIAESPLRAGLLWAGTNDGRVHVSRDGGGEWQNLTANIPDLPPWGTISNIEPSRYDEDAAYITVDLHQVNDFNPYVYKTEDGGKTWRSIASDIPRSVFSYAHCVREDPKRRGLLYLGTENSVYVSMDDGGSWKLLQNNLPHAPAHWLTIQERFNDLVVATYGRGFWILDDVTPLQQFTDEAAGADVHLFRPRAAYRFREKEPPVRQPEDPAAGENPPDGASIHYFLKEEPAGEVKLMILDSDGKVVRSWSSQPTDSDDDSEALPAEAGVNRFWWDLGHRRSHSPKLKTKPDEHSHVEIGDDGWRPLREGWPVSPLAAPGVYTVKLEVAGRELTETLEVLKDPSSEGSLEDIVATTRVTLGLRDMTNQAVAIIDQLESYRRQLENLRQLLKSGEESGEVAAAADALEEKLKTLEGEFFDLRLTNARQDTLRWGRRLYSKITILAAVIGRSDFPPTSQQMEVYELYRSQLEEHSRELERLRGDEIAEFNQVLSGRNLPVLVGSVSK